MTIGKKIATIISLGVIILGMIGYFSVEEFWKPLKNDIVTEIQTNQANGTGTLLSSVNTVIDKTNAYTNEIFMKDAFIEINGGFQRVIGKRLVIDATPKYHVIKMNNDMLTYVNNKGVRVKDVMASIADLRDFCAGFGGKLLYAQVPGKIDKYNNQVPVGIADETNKIGDKVVNNLAKAGVDTLDLRESIHDAGKNLDEMFFATDHHYTPEAGLWMTQKLAEDINAKYGFDMPTQIYNEENYKKTLYPQFFLGSQGKRVGALYGGMDDYTLVEPTFETNVRYINTYTSSDVTGKFEDVLLNKMHLDPTTSYFVRDCYATYIGGLYPIYTVQNNLMPEGKKIVVIGESNSCVVSPFLALGCAELHTIDLRHFDGTQLKSTLEQIQPDLVILLYNPTAMTQKPFYTFQ